MENYLNRSLLLSAHFLRLLGLLRWFKGLHVSLVGDSQLIAVVRKSVYGCFSAWTSSALNWQSVPGKLYLTLVLTFSIVQWCWIRKKIMNSCLGCFALRFLHQCTSFHDIMWLEWKCPLWKPATTVTHSRRMNVINRPSDTTDWTIITTKMSEQYWQSDMLNFLDYQGGGVLLDAFTCNFLHILKN